MVRLNTAEKNNQEWFRGQVFADRQFESEFEEIT